MSTPLQNKTDVRMREQLYVMPVATHEEALKRIDELRSHYPYGVWETIGKGHFVVESEMLVYPEGARPFMTEEEISKSEPYEKPSEHIICSPTVFRFMDEEFIDQFMREGTLRIATFDSCKNLEDKIRKDGSEGHGTIVAIDGSMTMKIGMRTENVFMFCTSLSSRYQENKCCLEIFRLPDLVEAIREQICKQGYWVITIFEGPCTYSEKIVFGTLRNSNIKQMASAQKSVEDIFATMGQVQNDLGVEKMYFRKPLTKSEENEYRVIWQTHPKPQQDYIIVHIDHPEQYARKIMLTL